MNRFTKGVKFLSRTISTGLKTGFKYLGLAIGTVVGGVVKVVDKVHNGISSFIFDRVDRLNLWMFEKGFSRFAIFAVRFPFELLYWFCMRTLTFTIVNLLHLSLLTIVVAPVVSIFMFPLWVMALVMPWHLLFINRNIWRAKENALKLEIDLERNIPLNPSVETLRARAQAFGMNFYFVPGDGVAEELANQLIPNDQLTFDLVIADLQRKKQNAQNSRAAIIANYATAGLYYVLVCVGVAVLSVKKLAYYVRNKLDDLKLQLQPELLRAERARVATFEAVLRPNLSTEDFALISKALRNRTHNAAWMSKLSFAYKDENKEITELNITNPKFECMIARDRMRIPVYLLTESGHKHNFDLLTLLGWLSHNSGLHPVTRKPISIVDIKFDQDLHVEMAAWDKEMAEWVAKYSKCSQLVRDNKIGDYLWEMIFDPKNGTDTARSSFDLVWGAEMDTALEKQTNDHDTFWPAYVPAWQRRDVEDDYPELCCPLTKKLMRHPVRVKIDGAYNYYDLLPLMNHLRTSNLDPKSGKPIASLNEVGFASEMQTRITELVQHERSTLIEWQLYMRDKKTEASGFFASMQKSVQETVRELTTSRVLPDMNP